MEAQPFSITIEMIGGPVTIIEVKPDGRLVFSAVNRAAVEIYGYEFDVLMGYDLTNLEGMSKSRTIDRKRTLAILKQCVVSKEPTSTENIHRRPDGSSRWTRDTVVPILDFTREVTHIMITSSDISELIETRKNLEDSRKRLEDSLTKTLSGFLKICANCKNIRHEDEWQDIETYASEQMNYHEFNHGMCSKCAKELYGDDILDP